MTEEQWQGCEDSDAMFNAIARSSSATARRLRLFACACVRRAWDLLRDENEEGARRAVEFAERLAEGEADAAARMEIDDGLSKHPVIHADAGWDLTDAAMPRRAEGAALEFAVKAAELAFREPVEAKQAARFAAWAEAARTLVVNGPAHAAARLADNIARVRASGLTDQASSIRRQELQDGEWVWVPDEATATVNGYAILASLADERAAQCHLLRDIVGNPFRPCRVEARWLRWNDSCVAALAAQVYQERQLPAGTLDQSRLAVLAGALEEAGCTDADLLGHLRGPGPHVRGCLVIDLLLDRK